MLGNRVPNPNSMDSVKKSSNTFLNILSFVASAFFKELIIEGPSTFEYIVVTRLSLIIIIIILNAVNRWLYTASYFRTQQSVGLLLYTVVYITMSFVFFLLSQLVFSWFVQSATSGAISITTALVLIYCVMIAVAGWYVLVVNYMQ